MQKKIIIIGSGFAGLSAACFMAKWGWQVTVLEKHAIPGGRARQMQSDGFTFDMGPSWYWMPDVFERFFNQFGKSVSDYYSLQRLDPSYRVYFKDEAIDIPADYNALKTLFEKLEPGSAVMLDKFMQEAAYKYQVGMNKLVYKPGLSLTEFADIDLVKGIFRLDVFNSLKSHVAKHFKHSKLRELMEFPVLFLGAMPQDIPALYSLMNYADVKGGTWYPQGGMYRIVEGMCSLARGLGADIRLNEDVTGITITNGRASGAITTLGHYDADVVLSAADYHFTETQLLPEAYRSYSPKYWDTRVMAPGSLLYYVGLNKKINGIAHHSLFFDASFEEHGRAIYKTKEWAKDPLFYASATSVTDEGTAPAGCENLFLLIPQAAGLTGDTTALRGHYLDMIIGRMEKQLNQPIADSIIFKKSFAHADFKEAYNAFKGNAYGLANTLLQTAILKPSCKSSKLGNMFYAGQLTVPGPGVPPSIISGEVVAKEITRLHGGVRM